MKFTVDDARKNMKHLEVKMTHLTKKNFEFRFTDTCVYLAENANEFAYKNYGVLCGAISAYGQLFTKWVTSFTFLHWSKFNFLHFRSSKKSGRQELEESWSKIYCKPNVREAVDELLEIEVC